MSRDDYENWWIYLVILLVLLVVMSIMLENTNYEEMCTSNWRFVKPYIIICVSKGYPIFIGE